MTKSRYSCIIQIVEEESMNHNQGGWIDELVFWLELSLLAVVVIMWYRYRNLGGYGGPVRYEIYQSGQAPVGEAIKYSENDLRRAIGQAELARVRDFFDEIGSDDRFCVTDDALILRDGVKCGEVVSEREGTLTLRFFSSRPATYIENLIEYTWPNTRWIGVMAEHSIEIVRAETRMGRL